MERISHKDNLLGTIKKANDNNQVVDVSKIRPTGTGSRIINYPSNYRGKKVIIDNVPIVSDTYDSYKLATDILGQDYQYLADYYLIILEIKKGDKEYIKEIAETNYPALISNQQVFDFAMKILGPDYEYLWAYYDLAIAIRDDNYEDVVQNLKKFDPRDHNDFAYHIAKQYGNPKYIDLIKKEIIRRDWLERQALENILGAHSPYKELHQYIRKF